MKMPKENIDTGMFAPCGMNCKVWTERFGLKNHGMAQNNRLKAI